VLVTALAIAAASWAVVMALGPTLQIRAIVRRRSSEGVSVAYFVVLLVGFALWVAYGAAAGNPALVIPNAVAFVAGAATVAVAIRYR
jgi:MtN3 and saliva related transmembrane protein